ncbi:MAG TPA: ATP-binding protein [Mycobacteriales bacterium]|nr:ATP-binding protein [Mycobacteriales bacterium]
MPPPVLEETGRSVAKSAELLVNPGLDGVRAARRLTSATLKGLPDNLAADAELVVTELVTNAVLHGAPPICFRLHGRRDRVRVEVVDGGRAVPVRGRGTTEGMTGRGLAVIESLANSWGVEPADDGKLVWAELGRPRRRTSQRRRRSDFESARARWRELDPSPRYEIELGWVPTELLVAAKAHIDNIVREIALMQAPSEETSELGSETIGLLGRVTEDFSEARNEIKRQAIEAARRGDVFTNLTLHLPVSAATAGLRYLAAVDEADRRARSARLLTIAAPPSHRLFREWYVRALVDRLRAASRGAPPPPVMTFSMVLAGELDRVSAGEPDK